jgi:flagellar basal body rod protein FlgB
MAEMQNVSRIDLYDSTIYNLQDAMEISTKKQAAIAHNIANANTPGFRAVKFDEILGRAVERTERPEVIIEEEMSALADNSLRYSAYTKLLSSKINIIKNVVSQGRR